MKLEDVMQGIKILNAVDIKNVNINFVTDNTKMVKEDSIFVCVSGQRVDGHNLKEEARENGACCFVVEKLDNNFNGLQILVENSRMALSIMCRNFFCGQGMPRVIGITGTNGKTTTAYMLKNILSKAGFSVGIIGTEGIKYANKTLNYNMTTPDPLKLYSTIKDMYDCGVDYIVMEVSAHAMKLNKIDGINFTVKALTNITQDHLDFFKSFDVYKNCKVDFIKSEKCLKVVNNDDPSGKQISIQDETVFSYGIDCPSDVFAIVQNNEFSKYLVNIFDDILEIGAKVIGKFNVENALCAITIARLLNISNKHIKEGLEDFDSVPGRLNLYKINGKKIIIDFAHTPDAFVKIMQTIRPMTQGKLFCVFGCGGNRDASKRHKMGEIATKMCDYVIVTSDNPRFEDPNSICEMIASGIKGQNYEIIIDRESAIKRAYSLMSSEDILLILGKGAENYLDINGVKYDYENKKVVERLGDMNDD